jgi:CcmD family protein
VKWCNSERVKTVTEQRRHVRAWVVIALIVLLAGQATARAMAFQQPPPAQQEFVPVSELPQAEQLPAAPLVIAAYAFVWVALLGYLWSVRRRLDKVERELADVARKVSASERRA